MRIVSHFQFDPGVLPLQLKELDLSKNLIDKIKKSLSAPIFGLARFISFIQIFTGTPNALFLFANETIKDLFPFFTFTSLSIFVVPFFLVGTRLFA